MTHPHESIKLKKDIHELIDSIDSKQNIELLRILKLNVKDTIENYKKTRQSPFSYYLTKTNNNLNDFHLN